MTLKLADIIPLDVYNFQDIAGCARRFADQFEAGLHGEPNRVIVVMESDEGIALSIWGDNVSGYELMGILEAAKFRAYDVNVCGEE